MTHTRFVLTAVLLTFACDSSEDDEEKEGDLVADVSTNECSTGLKWVGGNEESHLMRPGADCIGCHTAEGEGPKFLVAGTIFDRLDEPDDCFGVSDVTVEIRDAEGNRWERTTNNAGNFWVDDSDGPLALPLTATVIADGVERAMLSEVASGACATCHTQGGANQAAGRIVIQ